MQPRRFALIGHTHNLDDLVGDSDDIDEGSTNLFFTDERAQDAVGSILADSSSVNFTYTDGTPEITAVVLPAGVDHGGLAGLSDDDHPQYPLAASTETISGVWTFTGDPAITIRRSSPQMRFEDTGSAANNQNWLYQVAGAEFSIYTYNDAYSVGNSAIVIGRSGAVPTFVDLRQDNLEFRLGAGSDLRLYHNGTDSIIRNDTGRLQFQLGANVEFSSISGLAASGGHYAPFLANRLGTSRLTTDASNHISALHGFYDDHTLEISVGSTATFVSGLVIAPRSAAAAIGEGLHFYTRSARRLAVTNDGRVFGTALHNNAGAVTGATNQYLASGTYTPTLTNVTNVAASTARLSSWSRVGNLVTVAGQLDVDPTAAVATELGISLPIASALTTDFQLGGAGAAPLVADAGMGIDADATNDRARMRWIAIDLTNHTVTFTFSYEVL